MAECREPVLWVIMLRGEGQFSKVRQAGGGWPGRPEGHNRRILENRLQKRARRDEIREIAVFGQAPFLPNSALLCRVQR